MFITQAYKYNLNGTIYVSAYVPEGAEILETMDILNAEEGYNLIKNIDGENMGNSLWLKFGDSQDNYHEEEIEPEPEEEPENELD